jgi:hypothetical protein
MEDIFNKREVKDLTVSAHYTIRGSLVSKVKEQSKKSNISESKVVDRILDNFFNKK